MAMNGTTARRLTLAVAMSLFVYSLACFSPVSWSPDSKWLAFTIVKEKTEKKPDGQEGKTVISQVWLWDVANDSAKLLAEGWALSAPAFTPDGKRVLFVECRRDSTVAKEKEADTFPAQLAAVEAESGKRKTIAELPGMVVSLSDDGPPGEDRSRFHWLAPSVAPDGKSVACTVQTDKDSDVILLDCTSRQTRVLARSASHPKWSPDGKWICFVRRAPDWDKGKPVHAVEAMTPDGRERVFLGELNSPKDGAALSRSWLNVSWHPDSKRVAYTTCLRPGEDEYGQDVRWSARRGTGDPFARRPQAFHQHRRRV